MARSSIRSELDRLRADIDAIRAAKPAPPPPSAEGEQPPQTLEDQIRHLAAQAQDLLEEAEDTVATHPAASLAAALVLGIALGRLTAR